MELNRNVHARAVSSTEAPSSLRRRGAVLSNGNPPLLLPYCSLLVRLVDVCRSFILYNA